MRRLLLTLALLLTPCVAHAQSVTLPKEMAVKAGRLATVEVTYEGKAFDYHLVGEDADCFREYTETPQTVRLRVLSYTEGKVTLVCWAVKGDKSAKGICVITVGEGPKPDPKPFKVPPFKLYQADQQAGAVSGYPLYETARTVAQSLATANQLPVTIYDATPALMETVQPGPKPEPKPDPKPPNPSSGWRVLITYETGKTYPQATASVLQGKRVRDYLNAKTADDNGPGTDQAKKAWRIWDKDTDASGAAPEWQDLMRRAQGKDLWIILSKDGTVFHEGPLPATVDETIALLKKFGG